MHVWLGVQVSGITMEHALVGVNEMASIRAFMLTINEIISPEVVTVEIIVSFKSFA